jgi:hypothetical protein
LPLIVAAGILISCTRTESPPRSSKPELVRITQFYTTSPKLPRGDKALLCYGVENAKAVWLSPPRQELTASAARCVEVNPSSTTTYTLSAAGADGRPITQDLTVDVGSPRARIVEVKISSLELGRGEQLNICYRVENAKSVEIEPIHFRGGSRPDACAMTTPHETTTYVVSAVGADGDKDEERVTVKVR